MFNITNYQEDATQNDSEIPLTPIRMAIIKNFLKQKTNVGEYVEKLEPLCTVGRNVKWCSSYGKQYGASLTN